MTNNKSLDISKVAFSRYGASIALFTDSRQEKLFLQSIQRGPMNLIGNTRFLIELKRGAQRVSWKIHVYADASGFGYCMWAMPHGDHRG